MRDSSSWSEPLRRKLKQSSELEGYVQDNLPNATFNTRSKEVNRLTDLIADVELGLTLLQQVAPNAPASAVSALLTGYRYPAEPLKNSKNWDLISKARFYLMRRRGRLWEKSLTDYIALPEVIQAFTLRSTQDIPQPSPTSYYPKRQTLYTETLSQTPKHQQNTVKLATEGTWYTQIRHRGQAPIEVPIAIPAAVADLAQEPQPQLRRTRTQQNNPITVSLEQLQEAAQAMDAALAAGGYAREDYSDRLASINFKFRDESTNDFQNGDSLTLEGLSHVVGLLNVGKTTFIEILLYHLAQQNKRCAVIVNDVAGAVQLASKFAHQFAVPAAPVLGQDRATHLKKVYESVLSHSGTDISQGGTHPAWRWFSPICPLLALVRGEAKWAFGEEPCHRLYQKKSESDEGGDRAGADLASDSAPKQGSNCTCPLYSRCPRHQLDQDIAQARIWVLTPGSWIHTRVSAQILAQKITFAEAVYRECDVVLVDEADRVQVQLDEAFAPSEVLLDNSGSSFLNRLATNVATLYDSNRSRLSGNVLAVWKRANDVAQIAVDRICHQLYNNQKLVDWLGPTPFTGRSLFARLFRELTQVPEDVEAPSPQGKTARRKKQQVLKGLHSLEQQERQQQFKRTVEQFLEQPLDPAQGGALSEVSLLLLNVDNITTVLPQLEKWWRQWGKEHEVALPKGDELDSLLRRTVLTILVTILDNRLNFLIERLPSVNRLLDLEELSQALVHKPPRDYLPVIPAAPVGNILGFRYTADSNSNGGKLDYFRYVGVGRWLLLNFPELFKADDWAGPHTLLISGTSYAPGTPIYHIAARPSILLEPTHKSESGISASQFSFSPQSNGQRPIAISGKSPTSRRRTAAQDLSVTLCRKVGGVKSFLEERLEELENLGNKDPDMWGDRQRILILTNSYDEADWVERQLQRYHFSSQNIDQIAALRRDQSPQSRSGIRRSQIKNLKERSTQIVVAPLMALERGHNILNDQRIAAFGTALFFCRPMPVPDDWQSTVQQLNAWAIANYNKSENYPNLNASDLSAYEDRFYKLAIREMNRLNYRAYSFKQLEAQERTVLCWTQLVSIWQVIGRLVRGSVPCQVYFLDAKFAPQTAHSGGQEVDTAETSLLIGIQDALQAQFIQTQTTPWQATLMRSLYHDFYTALTHTKGLNS